MIKAMKQALEALEEVCGGRCNAEYNPCYAQEAITTLRTAIAEAEKQEPMAWQVHPFDYGIGHEGVYARTDRPEQVEMWKRKGWIVQPLYTTPPAEQREWVGLTDEEIGVPSEPIQPNEALMFARVIEALLKEKNHG